MATLIKDLESLEQKILEVRLAQKEFELYTQEKVDEIFKAAALAANQARIPLAKLAVNETGMGVVEDKVIKNHFAVRLVDGKMKLQPRKNKQTRHMAERC